MPCCCFCMSKIFNIVNLHTPKIHLSATPNTLKYRLVKTRFFSVNKEKIWIEGVK